MSCSHTISMASSPMVTPRPAASSVSFLSMSRSEWSRGRQASTVSRLASSTARVSTRCAVSTRNLAGTSPLACSIAQPPSSL